MQLQKKLTPWKFFNIYAAAKKFQKIITINSWTAYVNAELL